MTIIDYNPASPYAEFGTAEHVTENIYRIPLPIPVSGLEVVNCYLVVDATGGILIDPGWATIEGRTALVRGLKSVGLDLSDIHTILVTHAHWDHYTQALALRETYGHRVLLGREERHTIGAFATLTGAFPNQVRLLRRAGATTLADTVDGLPLLPHERDIVMEDPDEWIDDGSVIELADGTITGTSTPGHTRGHTVFTHSAGSTFTGDHLLPRITPSLGFERAPEQLPLRSFMRSLAAMLARPDTVMLPAHGAPGMRVHARVRELVAHHDERLDRIAGRVEAGCRTAFDIAREMTWTRRNCSLADLDPVHAMTAVLEVGAHLDVLAWTGRVEHIDDGPSDMFVPRTL